VSIAMHCNLRPPGPSGSVLKSRRPQCDIVAQLTSTFRPLYTFYLVIVFNSMLRFYISCNTFAVCQFAN